MRTLVLVILCSLLFVVPCIADVSSGCSSQVVTDVFIDNQTPINYGWVGIQSIDTTIDSPEIIRSIRKEILKYDTQGRIAEYIETISEFGVVIETRHRMITSIGSIPQPSWVKRLGPYRLYLTQVFTGYSGYNDANYRVGVRVTKLEYVSRVIFGPRGRRIIIEAYYKPLPDQEVATVYSSFLFNLILTE